jgi:hypothetical protein
MIYLRCHESRRTRTGKRVVVERPIFLIPLNHNSIHAESPARGRKPRNRLRL